MWHPERRAGADVWTTSPAEFLQRPRDSGRLHWSCKRSAGTGSEAASRRRRPDSNREGAGLPAIGGDPPARVGKRRFSRDLGSIQRRRSCSETRFL